MAKAPKTQGVTGPLPPADSDPDVMAQAETKGPDSDTNPPEDETNPPSEETTPEDSETPPEPIVAETKPEPPHKTGKPWLDMHIEDEEIMGTHPQKVYSNLELAERGLKEFNRQYDELVRRKADIEAKMKVIGSRSAHLSQHIERVKSQRGIDPAKERKAFIQKQHEIRKAKAEKAQEFLRAGTNQKDVLAALTSKSKLDSALQNRRPSMGSSRPNYPQKVGG